MAYPEGLDSMGLGEEYIVSQHSTNDANGSHLWYQVSVITTPLHVSVSSHDQDLELSSYAMHVMILPTILFF